jgi:hypothetical protein
MADRWRNKLTYANVMVTILAFLVLGSGGAFAALHLSKNSVGTKQLKNSSVNGTKVRDNSLTGLDVDASTLGTVPRATDATNAGKLGGALASDYVKNGQAPGAWQNVTLGSGWTTSSSFLPTAQCYKDTLGVVHLRGEAQASSSPGTLVLTLPSECRPDYNLEVVGATVNSSHTGIGTSLLSIQTTSGAVFDDSVLPGVGGGVVLDSISYRATN